MISDLEFFRHLLILVIWIWAELMINSAITSSMLCEMLDFEAFLIVESTFLLGEEEATSVFTMGGGVTTTEDRKVEEFFSRFDFTSNFL